MRRASANTLESRAAAERPSADAEIAGLKARVNELEQLVQGLQDSVHRESMRQSKRIAGIEAQIHPSVLGRALSEDARERGL